MKKLSVKNKYFDCRISNTQDLLEKFKDYVNKYDCPEVTLDLSYMNIMDAAKVMILSSTYHFQKYPSGKVKCKVYSKNIKNILPYLIPNNLELV